MDKRSMYRQVILWITLVVLALAAMTQAQETTQEATPAATPASAPSSDELALAVGNNAKANLAAMAKYSWRVKSLLAKGGDSMATSLTEMRFNAEGKLDATNIGGESYVDKKPGLRGRRQKQDLEDFSAFLASVMDHSSKYIFPSKGTLVDIFDRAKITSANGALDVAAGDLFVKGDQLLMSIDSATYFAKRLNFKTTLEADTITGVVTFDRIPDGPCRPTKLEIDVVTQAVRITAETYDWVEQR